MNRGGKSCVDFNPMVDLLGHRSIIQHVDFTESNQLEKSRNIEISVIFIFLAILSRIVKFPNLETYSLTEAVSAIPVITPCRIPSVNPRHTHPQLTAIIA